MKKFIFKYRYKGSNYYGGFEDCTLNNLHFEKK